MENTDQILDAPQVETSALEYAGFWIRTAAYVVDTILLYVVGFVIGLGLGELEMEQMALVIELMIGIGYFAGMESSIYQGTLGKMAVGIRVGNKNGEQISFGNAVGRYVAKIISALVLLFGFFMVGWDEKKQGLHDKLADTFVFYRPQ
jgi:uncharacterized RDD family membrane protein YckC